MPSPSGSLASLRPDIGGSFVEFDLEMNKLGYISHRVFPVIESAIQSGSFGYIPIEQLLQSGDTKRAPGSGYSRGGFKFSDMPFATQEHGWEEPVDDREAKMYADYFNAEMLAGLRAYSHVLQNAEQRVADMVFNTGTWTGAALTTAVSVKWNVAATATPITDVEAAILAVYAATGLWPDALIINRLVLRYLRNSAQVIDRIASAGAGSPTKASDITEAMLAAVFDLEKIIVAGSSKNTANEGQAATPTQIWPSTMAMVCKTADTQDIKEPCIGRTVHWGEDGSEIGGHIETYRDEPVRSEIVRVRHDVDELLLYPGAGHLLTNIT